VKRNRAADHAQRIVGWMLRDTAQFVERTPSSTDTLVRAPRNSHRNLLRIVILLCALVFSVTPAQANSNQDKKRPPHKAIATLAWSKFDCGRGVELLISGVELRLSAPDTRQGALLAAEVSSAKPFVQVQATWDGKQIPFWPTAGPPPGKKYVYRALIGIDLEKPAGKYTFAVSADVEGGEYPVRCSTPLSVSAGNFKTERLTVAPNFVEPSPEQLAKAQEDSKKLREIFATVTPEKFWTGRFRVPLDGVRTGGNFGKRRVLNGQATSPHTGVDFPAPTGTPAHAAQRGRVVLAEPLYFSGNTVVVDHGWGVYTLYGHFLEIDVKAGEMVDAGAVLGKVGATGRVTGPHLHWGLTVNRAKVNALQIVALGQQLSSN
jgi:murein DD-endopeptidase MepM/ murein hydrolase activator NlpD